MTSTTAASLSTTVAVAGAGDPDPVTIVNGAGNAIATFLVDERQGPGAESFREG